MISKILGFVTSPLGLKILMYVGIAAGALLMLRWYGNRQWYKGELKGRETATQVIEKQKKAEWKAKEAMLSEAVNQVESEKQAVEEARRLMSVDRSNLSRTLKDALAKIQAEKGKQYEEVISVPDAELWDAIRALSGELAATQR